MTNKDIMVEKPSITADPYFKPSITMTNESPVERELPETRHTEEKPQTGVVIAPDIEIKIVDIEC